MVPVRDSNTSQALPEDCECCCRRVVINCSTYCCRSSGKLFTCSIIFVMIELIIMLVLEIKELSILTNAFKEREKPSFIG